MIFFSIGLPSAFAEWCDAFAYSAAFRALETVTIVSANSLEEVGLALMKAGSPNAIVRSRHPDGKLQRALIENAVRYVIALSDPRAAVEDLITKSGYGLPDAVRAVGTSCASMRSFAQNKNALILTGRKGQEAAIEAAYAICGHLGVPLSNAEISDILLGLDMACFMIEDVGRSNWWDGLSSDERDLIDGALRPYSSLHPTQILEPIVWGRDLFFVGDMPTEPAKHAVDVTGRARCLLYGPYIMVPAGRWAANVVLACSKEVSGMAFTVEILSGSERLGGARLQPDSAGVFEVAISFTVEKSSALPLEIRIFNERAAFDGRLGLASVTLIQSAGVSAEDRTKISEALGLGLEQAR